MKKILAFCILAFCIVSFSSAQIFKGEGETRERAVAFTLNFVEYTGYLCLFHMDGVSVFFSEDNIAQLEAVLEKFIAWEEMAHAEQISMSRTINSITFTSFHYNQTFYREPLIFYFVFTGGPLEPDGTPRRDPEGAGNPADENSPENAEAPPTRYTLYIETTLDRIVPFRLNSQTVHEMYFALLPEQLTEARSAYERQRSLEEMFN